MQRKVPSRALTAKATEGHIEAIRYHQRRGLVPERPKPLGAIRRNDEARARRLRFIEHAQTRGFSLDEVTDLLRWRIDATARTLGRLGANKLVMIRERIAQLHRIEQVLAVLVDQGHDNSSQAHWPLIASLEHAA